MLIEYITTEALTPSDLSDILAIGNAAYIELVATNPASQGKGDASM
jgi:hypothetical protein